MEILLSQILGPFLLVAGLSVFLYPAQWVKLIKSFQKDHFGLIAISFFSLFLGLILVRMYNVWDATPYVLITIIGWGALIKGVFYFLAPAKWITGTIKYFAKKNLLMVGGLIDALLGAMLIYFGYFV